MRPARRPQRPHHDEGRDEGGGSAALLNSGLRIPVDDRDETGDGVARSGPVVSIASAAVQVPKTTRVPVDGITRVFGIDMCTAIIVFIPVQCMGMM